MTTESLRRWTQEHTEQETMQIIETGETIYFEREQISTADLLNPSAIHAAYLYYAIEQDRRDELRRMRYLKRAKHYIPRPIFGYEPYTFIPAPEAVLVQKAFQDAAEGVS